MHLQPVENIHISIMYYTCHHFPIRGKEIVSTKLRPKSAYDLQFIVCLFPALDNIFRTPMAQNEHTWHGARRAANDRHRWRNLVAQCPVRVRRN